MGPNWITRSPICPYVANVREEYDLPLGQKSLLVFDCFRGQITKDFRSLLKSKRLLYATVPPNCTDKLQPMDLSVNKCAKDFLKSEFQQFYAAEVVNQSGPEGENTCIKVDLSLTRMKELGAKWTFIKLYDYIKSKPDIVRNDFIESSYHTQISIHRKRQCELWIISDCL